MRQRFSFSLGQNTIEFWAKVYAIKACVRILEGIIVIGRFLFSQTVELQLKYLTVVSSAQSWHL
jgi:hypothetical protein